MIVDDKFITRRSFLKASASCLALGLKSASARQTTELTEANLAEYRAKLLNIVNIERGVAAVPPVVLDEFACQVESRHALEMASSKLLTHWGSDGLKPYQRYSFAGGTDYSMENVSATDQLSLLQPAKVAAELMDMNIRMHEEQPPNDGHRKTILTPEATHVGFGVALNGGSLRLAEIFICRHTVIDPLPRVAKPKAKLVINGSLLNHKYIFQQADVFYEPIPVAHSDRLMAGRSYRMPDEFVTLRPVLAVRVHYADGSSGTIDVGSHGKFRMPVTLFKDKPGIYTIMIWIKRKEKEPAFPVTQICIRAE